MPIPVSDDQFATAVYRLLRHGQPTRERAALLAGTVRRQLTHAAAHFARGDRDRGTNAVSGALYLLRIGEGRGEMFGADGSRALAGAIEKLSARGDEGRSLALMKMRAPLLPAHSTERRELDQHLRALQRWMVETRTGGEMARLAADQKAAVARALFDPTEETLNAAVDAVGRWIDRAVRYNREFHRTGKPPPRREAMEAFRALQTGGATLAALLLRYGRVEQAADRIERSSAQEVTPRGLRHALRAAAENDTARDWRELALAFAQGLGEQAALMDPDVRMAAIWGAAVEAYRRDPTSLAIAHLLADLLIAYGMPEVAPLVLADALGPRPSAASLSGAMSTVMDALAVQLDAATTNTARHIFRSSRPLLLLADRAEHRGRVKPSAAELRQLMAGIEIRSGNADAARPLMLAALEAEPTVWGLTTLATLERQVGNDERALQHAQRAATLPAATVTMPGSAHQLDAAEARLLMFGIHRDRGDRKQAQLALEAALNITLTTMRQRLTPSGKVRVERVLATVLDGYGDRRRASQAMGRALELAASHRPLLGPMMLAAISRGLVYQDLEAARPALLRGIEAEVEEEDLVYGALWVMLLERQLNETPDGSVERVLSAAVHSDTWTGVLAKWARGHIDDAALVDAAKSYVQRVEAQFYVAMRAHAAGRPQGTEQLRQIGRNPLIDLMEVHIARDVLAPRWRLNVPSKYVLP